MAKGHGKHGNKGHHHDDVMPSWAAALGIKWLGEDYDDIGRAWRGKGRNDVRDGTDDDDVLVAGKGHERYQEIRGVRRRYSDAAVVRAALAGSRR